MIPLLPRQAANGWTQYSFVVNPIAGRGRHGAAPPLLAHVHGRDLLGRRVHRRRRRRRDAGPEPAHASAGASGFEGTTPSYWTPSGAGRDVGDRPRPLGHALDRARPASRRGVVDAVRGRPQLGRPDPGQHRLRRPRVGQHRGRQHRARRPTPASTRWCSRSATRPGPTSSARTVVLDMPQTAASTNGWVQVTTSALGDISLPVDARSVTASSARARRRRARCGSTTSLHQARRQHADELARRQRRPAGRLVHVLAGLRRTRRDAATGSSARRRRGAHGRGVARACERLGAPLPGEEAVAITPRVAATPGPADARLVLGQDGRQRGPGDDRHGRQQHRHDGAVVHAASRAARRATTRSAGRTSGSTASTTRR